MFTTKFRNEGARMTRRLSGALAIAVDSSALRRVRQVAALRAGGGLVTAERDGKSKPRMGRTHSRRFVAVLACCVAVSAVLAGQASASQIFQERFHDEGTFVFPEGDFCDVEGLTVHDAWNIDGKISAVQRGPNGFAYVLEHFKSTVVYTNQANGKTATLVNKVNAKDLEVTDNGDGTLTLLTLLRGNDVLYGADGKAIGRNPGQSRYEILIDHGGTPNDPSDDEVIDFQRVKGSTGRTDDFCAAAVPALT
jgi:hypothetical protein